MPRRASTAIERRQGRALGLVLQRSRPGTAEEFARDAGVHVDTVRRIEQGGVASPGFFLVTQLADALGLGLEELRERIRRVDADLISEKGAAGGDET
ncbi:DNA-binding protein [Micropruina glycogenica]|uniref:DNA-binding protein n=1 Tax=Micropruina glycogenica TaxID=75385 RepID=A0A2N9JGP8_9ACTN|nr:DNA-binding protein [Micropruina glycogenica]